jgi:membrane-associated phospholipid phosphatase
MTEAVATFGRRYLPLPRGWRHLALQFAIWFGFLAIYQVARGLADHGTTAPTRAFENGLRVIHFEQGLNMLWELPFQRLAAGNELLHSAVHFTYWISEFGVLGIGLLWIYFRRHDAFARVRNTLLLANVLGLVGYVLMPTAPPRFFPSLGFVNTQFAGTVEFFANPYAAMPSLHAADALIIGVGIGLLCRSWFFRIIWFLWPAWVGFAVMATANHFWLDIVAGLGVAIIAGALLHGRAFAARRRTRIANAL